MDILCFCPTPELSQALARDFPSAKVQVVDESGFVPLLEAPPDPAPRLVFCGTPTKDVSIMEVAQGFRALFQDSEIHFVCDHQLRDDIELLKKNGFNGVLILPIDGDTLKEKVEETLASKVLTQTYRKVMVADFAENELVNFDVNVLLPLNRKYVRFISDGEVLSAEKRARLVTNRIRSAYIPASQIERFYDYVSNRMMTGVAGASATDLAKERKTSVRTIFLGLLDNAEKQGGFKDGKDLLSGIQKVVSKTLSKLDKGKILAGVEAVIDESRDPFSKAARVSSIASLLSLGTGIGDPVEVGVAGLLIDLGFSQLPAEMAEADWRQLSGPQKELYESHIEKCLVVARQKKLILSENVKKMIYQHHEAFDGSGFPKKLSGAAVMPEAQLLKFSDEIDYALNTKPGQNRMSLPEFIKSRLLSLGNPSHLEYNPEILQKICALFSEP